MGLKWDGMSTAKVNLPTNLSANILIASHDQTSNNASWIRLWGIDGQDKKQLASASWEIAPKKKLPEFDLKLSIFRNGSLKPEICYFTVRPASYLGPLEMFICSQLPYDKT